MNSFTSIVNIVFAPRVDPLSLVLLKTDMNSNLTVKRLKLRIWTFGD